MEVIFHIINFWLLCQGRSCVVPYQIILRSANSKPLYLGGCSVSRLTLTGVRHIRPPYSDKCLFARSNPLRRWCRLSISRRQGRCRTVVTRCELIECRSDQIAAILPIGIRRSISKQIFADLQHGGIRWIGEQNARMWKAGNDTM